MKAYLRSVRRPERALLALLFALLLPATAGAVVTGQCVQARGGNSCTAGDVTFILVGLGNQTDGCMGSNDTLSIYLGGQLQNTSANTRYDVGMYIYNYLGTETAAADPVGYAYNGTSCARESLKPVGTLILAGSTGADEKAVNSVVISISVPGGVGPSPFGGVCAAGAGGGVWACCC